MSEKTKEPTWAAEIETALQAWFDASPETRSIIAIAVNLQGKDEINATIMGDGKILGQALTIVMGDGREYNAPGRVLRIAAMMHLMNHAKEISAAEINHGDKDQQDNESETENTESHE